ncbi:MAG: outer membrane protein transport protein [Myxococcales bacterium]
MTLIRARDARQRGRALALSLFGLLGLQASAAHAAGFELNPPGTRALGRAGTGVAGADDALGVFLNPATILANQSRLEAALSLQANLSDTCMTRVTVNATIGADGQVDGPQTAGPRLPKACDDGGFALIPELANTLRLGDRFAVSLGLFAPTAPSMQSKFGNPKTGTLDGKSGEDRPDQRTGTRYLMMEQKAFQVFPTLGAAYEPFKQLRLGASFGWGVTKVDFTNAVFSHAFVNTTAYSDISNRLTGTDAFVPRVQVGAWTQPSLELPLEFGANFTWTQDVQLHNAHMRLRGLNTDIVPPEFAALSDKPKVAGDFDHIDMKVPSVSQLSLGARYAKRLDTPVDAVGDRLSRERFDLEFNLQTTFGKNMDSVTVDAPAGYLVRVASPPPGVLAPFSVPIPEHVAIPHRWKTQYSLRLGGDYNPIPGLLGLRAGVSYETNGVTQGYQNIDFTPFENVGIHLGATLRLAKKFDISLAFAHFMFPDVKVAAAEARVRRVTSGLNSVQDAAIVNAGTYTRSTTSFALQLGAHF